MKFKMIHNNINITDLDRSIKFYEEALGFHIARVKESDDGSFKLVYLEDGQGVHQLELTWLKDHPQPYDLGENEFHLAVETEDFEKAHELHEKMGCICFENPKMGIYFIHDPDDYWIEILPVR